MSEEFRRRQEYDAALNELVTARNASISQLGETQIMSRRILIALCLWAMFYNGPTLAQDTESKLVTYQTKSDIPYRATDDLTDYMKQRCRLDLYYPADTKNFATVVWFHGGGLTKGDREIPEGLQQKGIAVVAPSYRLSPRVKSPAYIQDAAAAVAWAFRNIENYGGARERIFVSGHSAGGYLTSMIGLDKRWLEAQHIDADRIAGLIPYSGQAITHFTVRGERGIDKRQPIIDDMAPLFHVRRHAPPVLLITGDRELEMLGRYEENAYLWRMMNVVGHSNTQIIEIDGANHGEMAIPAHPSLLRFLEQRVSTDSISVADN